METKEYLKLQAERTIERLAKKADTILDDAEEDGYLGAEDVHTLKDAWEAICHANHCLEALSK